MTEQKFYKTTDLASGSAFHRVERAVQAGFSAEGVGYFNRFIAEGKVRPAPLKDQDGRVFATAISVYDVLENEADTVMIVYVFEQNTHGYSAGEVGYVRVTNNGTTRPTNSGVLLTFGRHLKSMMDAASQ